MTTTETALNETVHQLLLDQIKRQTQLGTQVAAYKDGELIVDAWAGEMGPEDARPVQADSLFLSFSTTKGVAATALHILADRGVIDYDAPVAKYWPEFAANGKGNVTVAQAMSHQAGLHAAPPNDVSLDWDRAIDFIANGVPAWEPGTATGYHAPIRVGRGRNRPGSDGEAHQGCHPGAHCSAARR
ncbi:MAG: serine hydrolase domain-containing protein [Dehalococcoidia bacterium]